MPARTPDVLRLPPPSSPDGKSWERVWDAMSYSGGGPWASFERLALHIEPTPLAVGRVARSFQSLGHMDYAVDPTSLTPVRWEIAPTALVPCGDRWYAAGDWPAGNFCEMTAVVKKLGGRIYRMPNADGPPSWFISDVDRSQLEPALAESDLTLAFSEGAIALAAALPRMSEVVEALPRRQLAHSRGSLKRWHVDGAVWVPVTSMDQPGAYRLTRFRTEDFLRTPADVDRGTLAVSNVYFSKHAAAYLEGRRPYLSWTPETSALCLPLGADLPGLYARSVVMASGMLPSTLMKHRLLTHPSVPRQLAEHLAYLLSH